jgi:DNA-binding transcriptional ArsR family regulator
MTAEPSGDNRPQATRAQAAALASAVRLRIIRLTFEDGLTNQEIAQRLGKDPATTLYHVRKLVATGFLVAGPARAGSRGAREIPYRSTGLSWRLRSHPDKRAEEAQAMLAAFLGEIAEVGPETLDQGRLVLRLDPAGRQELNDRFSALMNEFVARPRTPDGKLTAVYLAIYPGE